MFVGIDHVGIAVRNLDKAVALYRDILGLELEGIHELKERKVRVAFFSSGGQSRIELLEPIGSDSPVAKFLGTRGEGIHHMAIVVNDIRETLENLRQKGMILVDDKPETSAERPKVAFVHPKSTCGVLLELIMKESAGHA